MIKIKDKFNRIRRPADFWLLVQVMAMAAILPCLLKWVKLPVLVSILRVRSQVAGVDKERIDTMRRFVGFALNKNIIAGKSTCLKKSLLLYYFLGRAGIRTELNLGIKKTGGLVGHCWLTCQGNIFLETQEFIIDFEPIFSTTGAE